MGAGPCCAGAAESAASALVHAPLAISPIAALSARLLSLAIAENMANPFWLALSCCGAERLRGRGGPHAAERAKTLRRFRDSATKK
jgi:hypothetical protein